MSKSLYCPTLHVRCLLDIRHGTGLCTGEIETVVQPPVGAKRIACDAQMISSRMLRSILDECVGLEHRLEERIEATRRAAKGAARYSCSGKRCLWIQHGNVSLGS